MSRALWDAFATVAERHPRRVMVRAAEGGEAWTAPQLRRRAADLATQVGLARARGGCVAFCRPTGADWLVDFLAMQHAGVAALPLDPGTVAGSWTDAAADLGATHALDGGTLHPLRTSTIAWRRFAAAKVTSGSTGQPTLVPCRAAHLLADGDQVIRSMGLRPGDRNLAILPLGHSYGLGNLVMPLILQGTAMITAERWVPREVLAWIDAHRITVLPTVPLLLRLLAEVPGDFLLRSLRLVISAGAPLPPDTARAFLARTGRRVHNFYGSSETGGICFDASGAASLRGDAVGRPMAGVRVTLGRSSRIRVTSPAVTARGGSLTLPDVGEWTAAGELRVVGRAGAVANVGGRKVSPLEVERTLLAEPGVNAAWVAVITGRDRDHLVAAVETARPRESILASLAERLPPWKRPRDLVAARELPRTARGKLDRTTLRSWFGDAPKT